MRADGLTIDVTATMVISGKTVERCLRLIEMWLDDNRSVLRQIKEIEQLYERVTDILPAQKDVEMFDRMVEMLPERMWVE